MSLTRAEVKQLAQRELAATAELDSSAAYARVCMVVRRHVKVLPELAESVAGVRRLIWPDEHASPPLLDDPGLFDPKG